MATLMPSTTVLLAETTRSSLLVVDLETGEQMECPILETCNGNFTVDTDLPKSEPFSWHKDPILTDQESPMYGIELRIQHGPALIGRIQMTQDEYNRLGYEGYRHEFNPSQFALVTDGDKLKIVAAKVRGRWYPVYDSAYFVAEPPEAHSE